MPDPAAPRQLKLRFPGTCKVCGTEIAKGTEALHFKEEKKVACLTCVEQPRTGSIPPPGAVEPPKVVTSSPAPAPAPAPTPEPILEQALPGTSAKREHSRRQSKREAELVDRWGSRLGKALAWWEDDAQSTASWNKGAEGERKVGAYLEKKLDGKGCELLHDRRVPGSRANIDHIAIGPRGVLVIDAKNIKGKVRATSTGIGSRKRTYLTVDGRDRNKLIAGMNKQIEVVRAVLAAAELLYEVDVSGCLCWWHTDGLPFPKPNSIEVDGVRVLNPRSTAYAAEKEGPLNPSQILEVAQRLDETLRPA